MKVFTSGVISCAIFLLALLPDSSLFAQTQSGPAFGTDLFANAVEYAVGSGAISVATGDIDGDGKIDIAVIPSGGNTINILRNIGKAGTISFDSPVSITLPYYAAVNLKKVIVADIDGNGKKDLVVQGSTAGPGVSVLRNISTIGSISFSSEVTNVATGVYWSAPGINTDLAVADLDKDGKPEIITTAYNYPTQFEPSNQSNLQVNKNKSTAGKISFEKGFGWTYGLNGYVANSMPVSVTAGDLDADGLPDLIVTDDTGKLRLFRNNSTASALSFADMLDLTIAAASNIKVTVGDVDGNGKPDLLFGLGSILNIYLNNSTTTFAFSNSSYETGSSRSGVSNVVLADFDKDGKVDVAMASDQFASSQLNVYHNNTSGTTFKLSAATNMAGTSAVANGYLDAADFDGDGKTDVTVLSNSAIVFRNKYNEPTITSFNPKGGLQNAAIIITGTNFTGATAVSFGGTPAASFTVNSATQITATVAKGTSGAITVTTPFGSATADGFSYYQQPTIISLDPTMQGSGGQVVITGTNFTGVTAVTFGNIAATAFTVDSPTQITATVGNGASGAVSVTSPGGNAGKTGFVFVPKPVITSINPSSAKYGDTVTITGSNFQNTVNVTFGGIPALDFSVKSATSIKAVVAAGASGPVAVTTLGTPGTYNSFTYVKTPQSIIFTAIPAQTFGAADLPGTFGPNNTYGYQLYANSNLNLTLQSSNTAVATIVNGKIHITGAGTTFITASQAGNSIYATAISANQTLTVNKAPQTITFNTLPGTYTNSPDLEPAAESSSGLQVTYSSDNTNVATIVNGKIHIVATGTANITATQAGNANYLAATPVSRSLTITTAPPAPVVSYPSTQNFTVATAITPLKPSASGTTVSPADYGQAFVYTSYSTGGTVNYQSVNSDYYYTTAVDASGNVYVGDGRNNAIKRISPTGIVSNFANIDNPFGVATDAAGNVYVAQGLLNTLKKISSNGQVSAINLSSYTGERWGDSFNITAIATDVYGKLYVAGYTYSQPMVYIVNMSTKNVSKAYGNYNTTILSLAVDKNLNIYAGTETSILKNGEVLAGGTIPGSANGTGAAASFNKVTGLAVDGAGNVYAADKNNNLVRMISPAGVVSTVAGTGLAGSADGAGTSATFSTPFGLSANNAGVLYVGDAGTNKVRKLVVDGYFIDKPLPLGLSFDGATGTISGTPLQPAGASNYSIAANNIIGGSSTTNLSLAVSPLAAPVMSYAGPKTFPTGTAITAFKPTYSGGAMPSAFYGQTNTIINKGVLPTTAYWAGMDKAGNIYTFDELGPELKKISPSGEITTVAGPNQFGAYSNFVGGSIAVDADGNTYLQTGSPTAIRKVSPTGQITTFAATNLQSGHAYFYMATGTNGVIYLATTSKIYQVSAGGAVSLLAGSDIQNTADGTGSAAGFSGINGITTDVAGNIFVTEAGQNYAAIRMITTTGVTTTVAGGSTTGTIKDGTGSAASFGAPGAITADQAGNLYVSDWQALRKIAPGGIVTTITTATNNQQYARQIMADAAGNIFSFDDKGGINEIFTPGYTISPALPTGLGLNAKTGTISGTPKQASPATEYTITATNISAAATAKLTIAVTSVVPPPAITYTATSVFTNGAAISTLSPTNTGGTIPAAGYKISPALPAGLVFDVNTGAISGTPTAQMAPKNYAITATNSGGSSKFTISIAVLAQVPSLSYPDKLTYTIEKAISPVKPTVTGSGNFASQTVGKRIAFAGSGKRGYNDGQGITATFYAPASLSFDSRGNLYVADMGNFRVRKVTPDGLVSTLAGNNFAGTTSGNGSAASFRYLYNLSTDSAGTSYIFDFTEMHVRKVTAEGDVSDYVTVPDMYLPTLNSLNGNVVAVTDNKGNFIYASGNTIRKAGPDGNTLLAGNNNNTEREQRDGTGNGASFSRIDALAISPTGDLYVADANGYVNGANRTTLRKIDKNGTVTTLPADLLTPGGYQSVYSIAADKAGNVYLADPYGIKKITTGGTVGTLYTDASTSGSATKIMSVALDPAGLYLYTTSEQSDQIFRISAAGTGSAYGITPALPDGLTFNGSNGIITGTPTKTKPATDYYITGYTTSGSATAKVNITVNPSPPIISYVTPQPYLRRKQIDPLSPTARFVDAFKYDTDNIKAIGSGFNNPYATAADTAGNVYVAEMGTNSIKKIPAGGGTPVLVADGFNQPIGVAVDLAGNVYVADQGNNAIVKVLPSGVKYNIGKGFNQPSGVAIDVTGNVYVADYGSGTVKRINFADAKTITLAEGFMMPTSVAVDAAGNVYVADAGNSSVKLIRNTDGNVITLNSELSFPTGVAVDAGGTVYIAEYTEHALMRLNPFGGIEKLSEQFAAPFGLAIDGAGHIYIADPDVNKVMAVKAIGGYSIYPTLPAGLVIDRQYGTISGTPTGRNSEAYYTVVAHNSFASGSTKVKIQIVAPPTEPATRPYFTDITSSTASITWTNGSGAGRLVFISKAGSYNSVPLPVAGVNYVANSAYGEGTQIGTSGWYCIYDGTGSDATVSQLSSAQAYSVAVVEYSPVTGSNPPIRSYITDGVIAGNFTTLIAKPSRQAGNLFFNGTTGTTTTISWTNGNGTARSVFIKRGNDGAPMPADAYYSANNRFKSGNQIDTTGWYCVYNGVGSSVNVIGLTVGTTYRAAVVEYNGSIAAPLYLQDNIAPENLTTPIDPPTGYATSLVFSNTTSSTTTLSWVSSNGASRAVFMKLNSSGSPNIVQGNIYYPNAKFGQGTQAGTNGWYCVYNGTGNSVDISGLAANTAYRAIVIEYNGADETSSYNLTRYNTAYVNMAAGPATLASINTKRITPVVDKKEIDAPLVQGELSVHQAVSPNGDGLNDVFTIDGINAYPDNTVRIINANGDVIYSAKGYDNYSKAFDGRANNGKLQKPGTYFYSLDYTKDGKAQRKTGYLIVKY
ncbi:hypothetical protein BC343_00630 [Mucilaginibacter pedocola]|uniref:Fibronectin type-III domain-containing protein n=2 Tax=Mucilaginibacter pedocola TaxID=1792845 RepID=A0A1S9PKZ9_9SPHI|nr:hypothetical protein BC343_00630 [Mucilaginibacter pedocola]